MNILEFLSNNQFLTGLALVIGSYFLKLLVDHKAKDPEVNIWDRVKPGSDLLMQVVWGGVEFAAKQKLWGPADKLAVYMQQIKGFEQEYAKDKADAVKKLVAWYLSQKAKGAAENPTALPESLGNSPAVDL